MSLKSKSSIKCNEKPISDGPLAALHTCLLYHHVLSHYTYSFFIMTYQKPKPALGSLYKARKLEINHKTTEYTPETIFVIFSYNEPVNIFITFARNYLLKIMLD